MGMAGVHLGVQDVFVLGFVTFLVGFVVMAVSWISAKGAASAIRKMREMVESQNDKCISFTDTSTAEHFLPISMDFMRTYLGKLKS